MDQIGPQPGVQLGRLRTLPLSAQRTKPTIHAWHIAGSLRVRSRPSISIFSEKSLSGIFQISGIILSAFFCQMCMESSNLEMIMESNQKAVCLVNLESRRGKLNV